MDTIKQQLSGIAGGRVLDLATGSGAFALRLAEGLASYDSLVAIDSQPKAVAAAARNLAGLAKASALEGDAAGLPFPDGSFDLVAVANSLHHFPDPAKVLAEGLRVLSPGGHLVVLEMHREATDEAAMTHVLLHHWWAGIDSANGTFHAETMDRRGIQGLLSGLGLKAPAWTDVAGEEADPFDPDLRAEIEGAIDAYLAKIPKEDQRAPAFAAEGEALRERAGSVGFRSAPSLFFVGRKSPNA
jgi:SAM-dependent methyltransferase